MAVLRSQRKISDTEFENTLCDYIVLVVKRHLLCQSAESGGCVPILI